MRAIAVLGLFALMLAHHPSVVRAGPVEQLIQLDLHPANPDVMVLRYENGGDGLLYSRDGGKTFRMLCASAIDSMLRRSGPIRVAGDGVVFMGVFEGLWQDDGRGCGWSKDAGLDGRWVTDIARHPMEPEVMFAVTSNGDEGAANGMWRRAADGTWSELGTREDILLNRLHVASIAGGLRFYAGALVIPMAPADGGVPQPQYSIRVSEDDGETWQEHSVEVPPGGSVAMRLIGIDPTDPDRLAVLMDRPDAEDVVMVSTDQGATFGEYLTIGDFGGIAFAPDGRVWIADRGSSTNLAEDAPKGLWAASTLESPAALLASDYGVQCLGYHAPSETLYACQKFLFGKVDVTDGTFTTVFDFRTTEGFVVCDGMDMPATCETQFCGAFCGPGHFAQAPLCAAYDAPACGPCADMLEAPGCLLGSSTAGSSGSAAGTGATSSTAGSGAGASGGAPPRAGAPPAGGDRVPASDSGGCACSLTGNERSSAGWAVAAVLIMLLRRRRR